jgi:hypothetical protein
MNDAPNATEPFVFELSSTTRAIDDTIVIAVHRGAAVLLLRSSADAAQALADGIAAELGSRPRST